MAIGFSLSWSENGAHTIPSGITSVTYARSCFLRRSVALGGSMRQILFILAFGLVAIAQDTAPTQQLTQVPPKPSCNPNVLFHTTACEDLWNAYNAALQQR